MARSKLLSTLLLYPLSRLYGIGVWVRNRLFDHGALKSINFDIPVVAVGNIAVGGTGKTPHVEYLIETLSAHYNIAVLSRGYKRSTTGFILASPESTPAEIGDESYQIYSKYGALVTVAVCESRVEGINRLLELNPAISMVLLDDAFQHRYVKPSVSIVLTEFNRPVFKDHLLPYGRLREQRAGLNRADIVVVTKCPADMKPMQYRIFEENLNLFPFQKLFFSSFHYGAPVPVFPDFCREVPRLNMLPSDTHILAVSGVDNPRPFVKQLRRSHAKVKLTRFSDHHSFSASDIERVADKFDQLPGRNKFILTTEKDAVRMRYNPFIPDRLKGLIFYIPVKVRFIERGDGEFADCVEKTLKESNLFK